MKDLATVGTIQLTRIHALDWYGFSGSFDLAGQTLITGIYGCGKTALVDLIQTVLLGAPDHEHRYNLSVGDVGGTAATIQRDLRGYALQDLNVPQAGGKRSFGRANTRTYIALEWTWPNQKKRETWGLRIEYTSEGAEVVLDYWRVPARLEFEDFLAAKNGDDQIPLDGDAWLQKLTSLQGQRYATKTDYLESIAAAQHLNYDARVFKPLLIQTLRFTFGRDFNEFCRDHILPESPIDIDAVRDSYDRYRDFLGRIKLLEEQQQSLEQIATTFKDYHRFDEEVAALGWFQQNFRLEEKRHTLEKATKDYATVQAKTQQWSAELATLKTKRDRARAEEAEINARLAGLPNAQEFSHFKKRQQELPNEISQRTAQLDDPAAVLRQANDRLHTLAQQSGQLSARQKWTVPVLPANCPTKLPAKPNAAEIESTAGNIEAAAETLAERWKDLAKEASAEKTTQENRQVAFNKERARLRENLSTENLLLHDALKKKFNPAQVRLVGNHCEVVDEDWADALELNFGHKFATLVPDESIADAFRLFNSLPEVNPRERLACPADFLRLPGKAEPGSLAQKIISKDPAVTQLLAHLFGDIRCCQTIADAEKFPRAVLPSGAMKEPTGRRRPRATPSEYAIGQKGREKMIARVEANLAALEPELEKARALSRQADALRDGFLDVRVTLVTLRRDKLATLRELEALRTEQASLAGKLELFPNREALETLRDESRAKDREAKNLDLQVQEKVENAPPQLSQKKQELDAAKEAHDNAETSALEWQNAHPTAIAAAAKHAKLEAEMRDQATPAKLASEICSDEIGTRKEARAAARTNVLLLRQKLHDHPRITDSRDSDVNDLTTNALWDKKLAYILETGLKDFTRRMQEAETEWEERFQKNVLGQLFEQLGGIQQTIRGLQRLIAGRKIGGTTYAFRHNQTDRADFNLLRTLATDLELHNTFPPGSPEANEVRGHRRDAMKLFELPPGADRRAAAKRAELLDPRRYYTYDLDIYENDRAEPISLNARGRKGSGGETYNPYLVALITAYMRAYNRHEQGTRPSISLLLMDEAFKVNDTAAVRDCVGIIAQLGLQGVISCTNTVGSQVIEHFDWAMIVQKQTITATSADDHVTITNTVFPAPKNNAEVLRIIGET
jgi:hypothetical protein